LSDIQGVVYMYGYGGYYIGNRRTRELHLPGCVWAIRMSLRCAKISLTDLVN